MVSLPKDVVRLLRLNNLLHSGKVKDLHTILLFLNIAGAFGNAWLPTNLNLLKKIKLALKVCLTLMWIF